jgi:tRNA threonylcarbamoyladenosine biosynthesis protein TsaB
MIILTIRTDKPESEIGLYDSETQLAYETWEAHRQLAETIHNKIQALLESKSKKLKDIQGIVVYIGPGSFTGLRIGISVANALAYSLAAPIIGITGSWIEEGIARIKAGENDKTVVPEYGAPVHVTTPKK